MNLVTLLNQMRPLILTIDSSKDLPHINHTRMNSIFLVNGECYIAKKDRYLKRRSCTDYDFK